MYRRFIDFIIDEYAHNRRVVLIVDEAQNMAAETLEELRMLSNVNADKDQALQVILVGQRELRDTLRRPDLIQFAQRISVDYHLEPLSEEETVCYIRHRLEVAGGNPLLFEEDACRAVYRYSNGVPRLINLLCDTALVYGYAEQHERIGTTLVTDVAREKQQGGIFPTFHPATPVEMTRTRPDAATADTDADAETGTVHEVDRVKAEPSVENQPEPHSPSHRNIPETICADKPHEAAADQDIEAADAGPGTQPTSVFTIYPRQNMPKKKEFV